MVIYTHTHPCTKLCTCSPLLNWTGLGFTTTRTHTRTSTPPLSLLWAIVRQLCLSPDPPLLFLMASYSHWMIGPVVLLCSPDWIVLYPMRQRNRIIIWIWMSDLNGDPQSYALLSVNAQYEYSKYWMGGMQPVVKLWAHTGIVFLFTITVFLFLVFIFTFFHILCSALWPVLAVFKMLCK